ncbi:TIGR03084 family metal-binding protein [Rhodococcus erythropolis]|uniref:TIGR03084 family metal-binding protein n=1 Tax=Rhodococcus erythropolis TaxID=1833 RepID=UPI002949632A|nr:TIGR03084 family metal-binding protein [Rhodococcus erythropolis]MDV6212796.1 TIGR03084 family metal-binding protein [Rhodococcus erythropolis]
MSEDRKAVPETLLADLRAEAASVRALVSNASELAVETPAPGWNVRDTIAHLVGSDEMGLSAVGDPEGFVRDRPGTLDGLATLLASHLNTRVSTPYAALRSEWANTFDRLVSALESSTRGVKVPWFGPPMSPTTMASARLMEYWAHGQDIANGLGLERQATDRIAHVCHIGVRTFGFSFAGRKRVVPDVIPSVDLVLPSGKSWVVQGDPAQRITGPAVDFALVVTRRTHPLDTDLSITGPIAEEWMSIAQCFAGPPGEDPKRKVTHPVADTSSR